MTIIRGLLTMCLSAAFKTIKNLNKEIKMSNLKASRFRDDYIELDSVHEVLNLSLEIVIKQMLNLSLFVSPVIISVPVLTLYYLISRQPIKQIMILGVSVFVD